MDKNLGETQDATRTRPVQGQMPRIACILTGGSMFNIQVNGERYIFEMHPYSGPALLKRNGEPKDEQPKAFLEAASLWAQQGQKVEDGLCVWFHEPKPILKHLGGRHYQVLGHHPAVKGE